MTSSEFWKEYVLTHGGARYRIDVARAVSGERIARFFEYGFYSEIENDYSRVYGERYQITVTAVRS